MARPVRGNRKRLLYSTGTAAAVLGVGVALVASPALAVRPWAAKTTAASPPAEKATNLALNKKVTGSAACTTSETPAQAVNGTVDGGRSDKWCSGARTPRLTIDLGRSYDLTSVTVQHAQAGGEDASLNTRAFTVRVSADGKKYTTVTRVRNNHAAQTTRTVTTAGRYVQLLVSTPEQKRHQGAAARIYEVAVTGANGTTTPPTATPPTATTAPPKPTAAPTPTSTVTQKPTTTTTSDPKPTTADCHTDAPATLTDYVAEHTDKLTRVGCNGDVAVYYNDQLKALPAAQTAWVTPFATDVWKYLKKSYGACDAPRTLTAKVGTACEQWGAPKPALFFLHKDTVSGGTVSGRFDAKSSFRTTNDIGYGNWKEDDTQLHDIIVHEACHQVEGASQGTHGSPAFPIWGDSKWAEFCLYDFYASTGRTADAERVLASFSKGSDNLPAGARNAAWFKGWFLPLWQEGGKSPEVMEKFFGLTAQYFPTRMENDGADPAYTRSMNVGEYVLFTSAAAGKDLSGRAATVFNSGWKQAEFDQARKDFPALKF
ncbi:hypothetical protein GCM10022223_05140 [Kineosporia mesophila]|uniref:F5/8 type C domain-containing protein n=1 Tax=Kineosporia mesophila TaxID=566012 RepID=A0ABP6YY71_9ACTN|nr:discoidin domain-containing protein [Kineosporia mesophila]MCD5354276.1 discoidin domain-containing protein [Kineosporia mesophila]